MPEEKKISMVTFTIKVSNNYTEQKEIRSRCINYWLLLKKKVTELKIAVLLKLV